MNDADLIKKCYEAIVQQVFNSYWNDAVIAKPPPNQIPQIEAKFKNSMLAARQARDRAIALLPP
jgi:hypothetical protein